VGGPRLLKASTLTFRSGTVRSGTAWPLLVAWCCAHVPFGVAVFILSWSAGARHFDHQERLRDQVAGLLHHQAPAPTLRHELAGPPNLPVPHASPDWLNARLDAYFSAGSSGLMFPPRDPTFRVGDSVKPDRERNQPLLEPPRPGAAG